MILGYSIPPWLLVAGGLLLLVGLVFQILTGMRRIKLGKTHWKWHRVTGYAMFAVALFHGLFGAALVLGLRIG